MRLIKKRLIVTFLLFVLLFTIGTIQASDVDNLNDTTANLDDSNVEIDHTSSTQQDINDDAVALQDGNADVQRRSANQVDNFQDNPRTFGELYNQIYNSPSTVVNLTYSYKYDPIGDGDLYLDGVGLSRTFTLIGNNNTYIDGSGLARCFHLYSYSTITLINITIKNGYSEANGGGINLELGSTLILYNCTFLNNTVYNANGGAICSQRDTVIEINNCKFLNNNAVRVSDLDWNRFKKGMGSAIDININSNLTIKDSTFKNNVGYLSTILIVSNTDTEYQVSNLYVNNSIFENNTSNSNGVIYLDELGKAQILNSNFKKNVIKTDTGTLVLDSPVSATINNCVFEENRGFKGAAIHIKQFEQRVGDVSIISCQFIKNRAAEQGGAIYSKSNNLQISGSKFNENAAMVGGAIYSNLEAIRITGSSFYKNSASDSGGALYLKNDYINVVSSSFTRNSASVEGGAVYSKTQNVVSSGCSYSGNIAPVSPNVYGIYSSYVNILSSYYGSIVLKIKINSPWNMPISQGLVVKIKGSHNHKVDGLKTNSKGYVTVKVNKFVALGKYTITVGFDSGASLGVYQMKVVKAPCKFKANKLVIKHGSGKLFKAYLKNSKNNRPVFGAKIKLKFFTGKKFKTIICTTKKNGLIKLATKKLCVGKHIVKLSSADKNIKLPKKTTWIIIKK